MHKKLGNHDLVLENITDSHKEMGYQLAEYSFDQPTINVGKIRCTDVELIYNRS